MAVPLSHMSAQTIYRIDQVDSVATCSGIFTDDGGLNNDHSPFSSDTITICSGSTASDESHIQLTFSDFQISGVFYVYNGPSADPEFLVNTLMEDNNGTNPVIQATAANASGCLTIVYEGAGSIVGWEAAISCIAACQPVIATLDSTVPAEFPTDNGTIDICLGDTVRFLGSGTYPENGFIYEQSDESSTFEWIFDDGGTATGTEVAHAFNTPGGYRVQLRVTDVNGCESVNFIDQEVRVSPPPNFSQLAPLPDEICVGDTLLLRGSTQFNPIPNSHVFVTTDQQSFSAAQRLTDTTFLADGTGVSYSTSLEFANFTPGQVIEDPDDIVGVCLNMEHSFVGDLDISLECPNGSRIDFVRFGSGLLSAQYLGEPSTLDNLDPGVGFDYCWSNQGDFTMAEAVIVFPVFFQESIPAGEYAPVEQFSELVGCPLNGEWTIHVTDNIFRDNGYIFNWGIEFAEGIVPRLDTFTVGFQEAFWEPANDLIFYSQDSIVSSPLTAGTAGYTYGVTDDFGCSFDTTLRVEVLPFSHPNCYDCQPMLDTTAQLIDTLPGVTLPTNLASKLNLDTLITFSAVPDDIAGLSRGPALNAETQSTLRINSIAPGNLDDLDRLISICVDLRAKNIGDIDLYLTTPTGNLFALSTGNGEGGTSYMGTCFSPSADQSITAGTPPFSGTFLPEGSFGTLEGTLVNGDWTLLVVNNGSTDNLEELVEWSITFDHAIPLTYTWTPDDGQLSCLDCPAPTVTTGLENAVYSLTVTDTYGCVETGEVVVETEVTIDLDLTVENISCFGDANGKIFATASDGIAPYTFAWSTGATEDSIVGLAPGVYSLTVTDANGNTASDTVMVTEPDLLELETIIGQNSCSGDQTGTIEILPNGGTSPYVFQWEDGDTSRVRMNLPPGEYGLTLIDANGCSLSEVFTLEVPEPIQIIAEATATQCFGDNTGTISLTVEGGEAPYTYAWDVGLTTQNLSGLKAGIYEVTVTDALGCFAIASAEVTQPDPIMTMITKEDILCFGSATGVATVTAIGGSEPYEYLWNNGATDSMLTDLPAGIYSATVTDANGCSSITETVEITEPTPLICSIEITNEATEIAEGAVEASAEGGTPPYTFQWDDDNATIGTTLSGLGQGTYEVTITDANGCTVVCSVFVPAKGWVGDLAFSDENRDGIQDPEEIGLAGMMVYLLAPDLSRLDSTSTDQNGNYGFRVDPGDYRIRFGGVPGWKASPINQGTNDALDSDVNPANRTTPIITIEASVINLDVDAGFFDPCVPDLDSPGVIGFDQEICGPGNVPERLVEVSPPTGEVFGTINYLWMKTTSDPETTPFSFWSPIPNSNTPDFQPGVLFETTHYARCVRVDDCPYLETNIITITVGNESRAEFTGPGVICENETVTYEATGLPSDIVAEWDISGGAIILGQTNHSITLVWSSFGQKTITLTVEQNDCRASKMRTVNVINNPGDCGSSARKPDNGWIFDSNQPYLTRVFPNPSRGTTLSVVLGKAYDLAKEVHLEVYDVNGKVVYRRDEVWSATTRRLEDFRPDAPGLYLLRLRQGAQTETHRIILKK